MKLALCVAAVVVAAPAAAAEDPTVVESRVVVDAPVADVWAAFTTARGLESWMVGEARVDLRVGGELLTRYARDGALGDDATIVHTLQAIDPEHLLVWKPKRPPRTFPFPAAWLKTTNLLYFRALPDGRTEVVDRMIGYDATPESQRMRAFFVDGNRATFEALRKRFARH